MTKTGLVLLAAGASVRFGSPKQNLEFQGQTLLYHAVQAARHSGCAPVVVVLGAKADELRSQLNFPEITIVENPAWGEGMGASVRHGVHALLQTVPDLDSVLLMTCDQPFVSGKILQQLVAEKEKNLKKIIACAYQDTIGTPVLFDKQFFPDLTNLSGAQGAKKLLFKFSEEVGNIPFELGGFDIDTPTDYQTLQHYVARLTDDPDIASG
ncbi:nucleotidyltransferase family protein [Adhaeribacter pallidiroseus]|uniref:Molybdenum cofactor cytidylyltransferase n=1 Tax=Adhaeribacter pallidiroseus TaxID=2072847 RepID=A0A369QN22_9BACT|nr:nucleotidyltransferase family protein [Adhaeribacter pallidiroseus]RDC66301.1 Molybdenum cofactor cytidylyltransferase [Adhaeribacter pallidiroseus]